MHKGKKSALAKQAEKLFSFNEISTSIPSDPVTTTYQSPVIVQTFTTYSACEEPIPDPRKQQQKK